MKRFLGIIAITIVSLALAFYSVPAHSGDDVGIAADAWNKVKALRADFLASSTSLGSSMSAVIASQALDEASITWIVNNSTGTSQAASIAAIIASQTLDEASITKILATQAAVLATLSTTLHSNGATMTAPLIVWNATPSTALEAVSQAWVSANFALIGAGSYLTQAMASATFLQQGVASVTFLQQGVASATFLQQGVASATFLTPAAASAAYLQQAVASATFATLQAALTQTTASATYLRQDVASATFETQLAMLTALNPYLTQAIGSATYLRQDVASVTFALLGGSSGQSFQALNMTAAGIASAPTGYIASAQILNLAVTNATTTTQTVTGVSSAAQIIVGTETVASLSATTLQSGPATFTGGVSLGGNSLTASGGTNIQYYSSADNPVTTGYRTASYSTKIQDVLSEFDGATCTFKTFGKYSGYISAGYYDSATANTNVKLRVMKDGALYRTGQTALSAVNTIGEVVIPINDYFNASETLSAQTYTTTSTGLMIGDLSYTSMFVIIKDH